MITRQLFRFLAPLLVLGCLLAPDRAEAKGSVLITHGDTAKDLGEITPTMKEEIEAGTEPGVKMGYCYSYFGVFFLDLWTWDGKPCFHKDDTVWEIPEDVLVRYAAAAPEQVKKPFFYSYPEGLCIVGLLVVGAGGLMLFGMVSAAGEKKKADALVASDPRYAEALATLKKEGIPGKATALAALVAAGVPSDVARENVELLATAYLDDDEEKEEAA